MRKDELPEMTPDEAATTGGQAKLSFVKGLFDRVSSRYDLMNDVITLGTIDHWRRKALKGLDIPQGAKVLDVGTGSGKIPECLNRKRPDLQVTGMDISEAMLEIARVKCPKSNFLNCDATILPFEGGSFDLVVSAFVFRNLHDRPAAVREMYRVLAPGGRVMLLDTFAPRKGDLRRPLMRFWLRRIAPILVSPFARSSDYRYLAESILQLEDWDAIAQVFRDSGFRDVKMVSLSMGTVARVTGCRGNG